MPDAACQHCLLYERDGMMQDLGQYILSIGLAALLTGILCEFSDKKSTTGTLIRMICGLFLAFTVINPLADLNFGILETFSGSYSADAASAVATGKALAGDSVRQLIKQQTEAYILDKARSLGCAVDVAVTVGTGADPIPEAVRITGDVPAVVRRQLELMLEQDLQIAKENQQWIG